MGDILDKFEAIVGLLRETMGIDDTDERHDVGERALGMCARLREDIDGAEHLMEIVRIYAKRDDEQEHK